MARGGEIWCGDRRNLQPPPGKVQWFRFDWERLWLDWSLLHNHELLWLSTELGNRRINGLRASSLANRSSARHSCGQVSMMNWFKVEKRLNFIRKGQHSCNVFYIGVQKMRLRENHCKLFSHSHLIPNFMIHISVPPSQNVFLLVF